MRTTRRGGVGSAATLARYARTIHCPRPLRRSAVSVTTEWMQSVAPSASCSLIDSSVSVSAFVSVPQTNPSSAPCSEYAPQK